MDIRYSRDAAKAIKRMDGATMQRIREGIEGLTRVPPEGDIKLMQGFADRRQRLRVGSYRIIYRIDPPPEQTGENENDNQEEPQPILSIIDIGARGDIYK